MRLRGLMLAVFLQAAGASAADAGSPGAAARSGDPVASTWLVVFNESGRRMEIDPSRIDKVADGKTQAWGRMVFDKPVPDAVSGGSYRIVEALNRYDCKARTFATVRRVYRKDEATLLREEEDAGKSALPVRTGSLDDKLLRFACKPTGAELTASFNSTVDKAMAKAASPPRKELLKSDLSAGKPVAAGSSAGPAAGRATRVSAAAWQAPKPRPVRVARPVAGVAPAPVAWAYEGDGGPEHWGRLKPDYRLCEHGRRQSPIDLRDGIKVDLPAILFQYKPVQFRIIDNGNTVQVFVADNRITLMGKDYELVQFHFHKPSEERIDGKGFAMVVHLVHRSDDNKMAIVAVLLEAGTEHPVVQTLWNYLPLEKQVDLYPPNVAIDLNQLLPGQKDYFTYMGSLTTPPCSEGVLWLVMKHPVQVSPEQIGIFGRLHRDNARPPQPAHDRLVKESR